MLEKNLFNFKGTNCLIDILLGYLEQGKGVVLYFYPKDNTSGCTTQASDLQLRQDEFNSLNVITVGVSRDSLKSHENFASKHNLKFPLLSDSETVLCEWFEVWKEKSMYGKKYMGIERSTFYIDLSGIIQKEWRKVKIAGHWDQVLKELKK
ncbi:MAG: peroxiredoxin [Candidatus Puniceispirillum sp.]|nr:peroxiredoxin [Candidatus Pelagibacter sp.]MBA4283418.1 peroxiredoxin [Candidatus Puniceispirillum sp.]